MTYSTYTKKLMTTQKITSMTYTVADTAYCYSVGLNYDSNHYVHIETNLDVVDNILTDKSIMTIKINKVKYIELSFDSLTASLKCYSGNTTGKNNKISDYLNHCLICQWLLDNHHKIAIKNPMLGLFIGFLSDTITDNLSTSRMLSSSITAVKVVSEIKVIEKILQDNNISYPLPLMKLINFLKFHDLY